MSRFIVIEGLIGVGKTSLCKILREEWGADLVLEPSDVNPFLASFYAEPERFAFPAQMFYLASRYAQQLRLKQTGLFTKFYVADYLFRKDQLFAEQTLKGHELDLYYQFASLLRSSGSIPRPDFVLFLDAPTSVIMDRIQGRAITSEQTIQPEYLNDLRRRYYSLWEDYDQAPVYVVETTDWDYVGDPVARARMLRLIQGFLDGEPVEEAPNRFQKLVTGQLNLFEDR
ncbi:MAG: deoxyguanosine kinase [Myxococcota bacterium]